MQDLYLVCNLFKDRLFSSRITRLLQSVSRRIMWNLHTLNIRERNNNRALLELSNR